MQTLSTFNNAEYNPGNIFKRILWYLVSVIFIDTFIPFPSNIKILILKLFGAKIEMGVVLKPKLKIKYPWFLSIGANSWIGEKVWIDNLDFVHIANDVCISQGAFLLCGNHDYSKKTFDLITNRIIIEKGAWICAKAVVSPGVTCKEGSILSLGSVATSNLEKNSIYKGNPAIFIKERGLK